MNGLSTPLFLVEPLRSSLFIMNLSAASAACAANADISNIIALKPARF
jgi:hypothetical protein